MKNEYDFSRGKRGPAISTQGKTRITINLDSAILERIKAESARTGIGYESLINEALVQHIGKVEKPMIADPVRIIVREECTRDSETIWGSLVSASRPAGEKLE